MAVAEKARLKVRIDEGGGGALDSLHWRRLFVGWLIRGLFGSGVDLSQDEHIGIDAGFDNGDICNVEHFSNV